MRKHRISVRRADLPARMQQALDRMDAGRPGRAPAPRSASARRGVATALRGLVEAVRTAGLPERLDAETATAYAAALEARGATESAVQASFTALRAYARYTGEGHDWACESRGVDMRSADEVLRAPHWSDLRVPAAEALSAGLRLADLKLYDRFLQQRPDWPLSEEHARTLLDGSEASVRALTGAMRRIDPEDPDLPVLERLGRRLHMEKTAAARGDAPRKGPGGSTATISVPRDALPAPILAVIDDMHAPADRERRPWAEETVKNVLKPVRQVLAVAEAEALPREVSAETVAAWIRRLDARAVSARTRAAYLHGLVLYAERAGLDPELVSNLKAERGYYDTRARQDVKHKERVLAKTGLKLDDVWQAAQAMRETARAEAGVHRQSRYLASAALAVLSMLPWRARDLLGLELGRSVWRADGVWLFDFAQSKTGKEEAGTFDASLTPFLDDAILFGADPEAFDDLYFDRELRPLFCHADGSPRGYSWLYAQVCQVLSCGSHIARTLMHDHWAEEAAQGRADPLMALYLCGQRDPATAPAYEFSSATARLRAGVAQVVDERNRWDGRPPKASMCQGCGATIWMKGARQSG